MIRSLRLSSVRRILVVFAASCLALGLKTASAAWTSSESHTTVLNFATGSDTVAILGFNTIEESGAKLVDRLDLISSNGEGFGAATPDSAAGAADNSVS